MAKRKAKIIKAKVVRGKMINAKIKARISKAKTSKAKTNTVRITNAEVVEARVDNAKIIRAKVGKAKIIEDPKLRGEWAESVFMERAGARGLAVSKPWGDSKSYDFVVGRPGRFVGVQVKSTVAEEGGGYLCCIRGRGNKAYARGSFDFLAAYVVLENVWYIIPAEKVAGKESIGLFSQSKHAKFEAYREAWDLLREAAEVGEESEAREEEIGAGEAGVTEAGAKESDVNEAATSEIGLEEARAAEAGAMQESAWRPPESALERVRGSMNYVRDYMERGGVQMAKKDDDV